MAGSTLAEWLTSLPLRLMTEKYRPWTFQVALVYFKVGRFSMRHEAQMIESLIGLEVKACVRKQ